ncbi:MAG: peptide ABC transporter substrate-binding protein [Blastocatellia bacterium]|nr:peptide ABC transporter substrate-binding protein [Blastocatellia bacterium]MCS7157643.1 peptide ABC transporter substrate-binding protein [Blastocatellia bacterium]MCX7751908.1 peptide ABC transporter substrate-binding protein [Blastocatellia bacterium]MDW8167014.1 peptide ABC transporter substrate-binding protein [Acidobacteriota bacterium]MDW8257118.1 peptide ABC transporter substrate-binding protein [Acidobacteriota bacterium]
MRRIGYIGIGLLLFSSCARPTAYFGKIEPPSEAILRVGNGADPASLDPHRAPGSVEEQILINLFEGLTEYDPVTLDPIPAVAEAWEVNERATRFRFRLRRSARWSNGRPVTAWDFVYSWRRALAPETASPNAYLLYYIRNAEAYNTGKVKVRDRRTGRFLTDALGRELMLAPEELERIRRGDVPPEARHLHELRRRLSAHSWEAVTLSAADVGVRALDDVTLEVEMEASTAFFLKLTAIGVYRPVPREVVERYGRAWTRPEHIVSNGPFRLVEFTPGRRVVLEKNPLYWDAARVRLQRAIFYPYDEATTLLNLYKAGELDVLVSGLLPPYALRRLRQKQDYVSGPYLLSYFLLVNVRRSPLSDRRVRRALALAIDRERLCRRLLAAGQQPSGTFTPSDFQGAYPRPSGIGYDPERARQLLAAAGYPEGRGLRFRFLYNTGALHAQIAEALQADWRRIFPFIRVELVNQEWQVYLNTVRLGEFDIARRSFSADFSDPTSFLDSMLSTSPNNPTGWANPEYDRLVQQANAEPDVRQRMALLARAEEVLLDDLPIIPIYSSVTSFLLKPYVRGWYANVLDRHPLKFVAIERGEIALGLSGR